MERFAWFLVISFFVVVVLTLWTIRRGHRLGKMTEKQLREYERAVHKHQALKERRRPENK